MPYFAHECLRLGFVEISAHAGTLPGRLVSLCCIATKFKPLCTHGAMRGVKTHITPLTALFLVATTYGKENVNTKCL